MLRRTRHLIDGPDEWAIRPAIRDRVTVGTTTWSPTLSPTIWPRCQIVFCRNVLIYFSPEHAKAFLSRLAGQLAPGALLFLGYAETIWQVSDLFEPVRIGDTFEYFRRDDQAETGGPAPARPVAAGRRASAELDSAAHIGGAGDRHPRRPSRPGAPAPRRRRTAGPAAPPHSPPPATSAQQGVDLARIGQAAAADRDYPAAIAAFRKCVYLAPDAPMAHVHLGLALEAAGDHTSAHRAFDAARAALSQGDPTKVVADLGGYRVEELLGLLDSRQERPCP